MRLELGEKADAHQPASSVWVGKQTQGWGVTIHAPQGEERGVFRAAEGAHRTPASHTIAAMAATTPLITKTKCSATQVRGSNTMEPNRIHNARSTLAEGSHSGVGAVHMQQAHIVPQPTVSRQTHTRTHSSSPLPTATTPSME